MHFAIHNTGKKIFVLLENCIDVIDVKILQDRDSTLSVLILLTVPSIVTDSVPLLKNKFLATIEDVSIPIKFPLIKIPLLILNYQ
jgi:hypothetical protein